jgi:hypothetical protein
LSNLNGREKVKGGRDQVGENVVKMRKETRNEQEGLIIKARETGETYSAGIKIEKWTFVVSCGLFMIVPSWDWIRICFGRHLLTGGKDGDEFNGVNGKRGRK